MVKYIFEPEGQFVCFTIVPRASERYPTSQIVHRAAHIDFFYLRKPQKYAKGAYVRFLRCFREEFFGNKSARMTKERCEEFFNGDNFLTDDEYRRCIVAYRRGL